MDAMVIGIDVSKDRLDVAVRPTGESLIFKRTGVGIEDLIAGANSFGKVLRPNGTPFLRPEPCGF
jgi:transposase